MSRHAIRRLVAGAGGTLHRAPPHARLLAVSDNGITDITLAPVITVHPAPAVPEPLAGFAQEIRSALGMAGFATVLALPAAAEDGRAPRNDRPHDGPWERGRPRSLELRSPPITGTDPQVVDAIPPPPSGVVAQVRALAPGMVQVAEGAGLRIQAGDRVEAGQLLAQVHADTLASCAAAISSLVIAGIDHDGPRTAALLTDPRTASGRTSPAMRAASLPEPDIAVLTPGLQTTVQAWPGRLGLWEIGVPPSGPMDDLALRLANRCVGNAPGAAGLEICMQGPRLRFARTTTIALAGAVCEATCDGIPVPWFQPFIIATGAVLALGGIAGAGARAYLAVRGGLAVPAVLGSAATFTLGGFGGHRGRALAAGDRLAIGPEPTATTTVIPQEEQPIIGRTWRIGVLAGPHDDEEFLTPAGRRALLAAAWTVSPQSSRTGVRLVGPAPQWARSDGGEAGLHPSNIHDTAYAFAAVDLTGDTPIILGPDGPSTGGFVCPFVVVQGERWKLGQLRAGDRVELVGVTPAEAARLRNAPGEPVAAARRPDPLLHRSGDLAIRRAGDDFLLLEYGPMALDLEIRLRVHALHQAFAARRETGVIDLVPAVRSLQVHYDPAVLREDALVRLLLDSDAQLGGLPTQVPSRIVHMPLSWDDPSTRKAIEIYQRTVNPTAPWCPWNIEFIRRINGLASVDEVQRIVFDASYLVLGLGDVYLGAPVAVPVDPRHRLVTTKYNPARTWTPENAVGIGGAYMCIYGMEGPGGYQFVGRTVPVWAPWRQDGAFQRGTPWLLRPFDRIRYYPVTAAELEGMRADAPRCRDAVRIEDGVFDLVAYRALLKTERKDIAAFTKRRDAAYAAERARWKDTP